MSKSIQPHKQIVAFLVSLLLILVGITLTTNSNNDPNIGAGLVLLIGVAALFVVLIRFFFQTKLVIFKVIVAVIIVALVGFGAALFKTGENESNRIYCEAKLAANETPLEGLDFCNNYL